ncbi:MAG: hypothetical protein JO360_17120 [Acidobacteria bacterium]|nr:hypothetical protein [Acidobacteriota bacterium]
MRRNTGRVGLVCLWLLLCACAACAQQGSASAAAVTGDKELATVYVYRLDEGTVVLKFLSKTLPVYLGEREQDGDVGKKLKLAGLRNSRYFMLRLRPGKYVFDTRLMWGHLNLEVAAGQEYYLRLDRGNDCPSVDPDDKYLAPISTCEDRNPFVESVTPGRWSEAMKLLKPVTAKEVGERQLVIIPPDTSSKKP